MRRSQEGLSGSAEEHGGILGEVQAPLVETDREKRERRHYEYRDTEGRSIQAMVEVEIIQAIPEKEAFFEALLAQGVDDYSAHMEVDDQFPSDTIELLRSFVLTGENGVIIDVLAEFQLEGRKIYTGKGVPGLVVAGYDAFFTSELRTVVGVLCFLHEYGHLEQLRDHDFFEWQKKLPTDSPRRSESSPQKAILEFDANRRLVDRASSWRERGIDLMGSYPADFEDELTKAFLSIPVGEDIREEIRSTKIMSLEQFLRLQLLQHSLSEREF